MITFLFLLHNVYLIICCIWFNLKAMKNPLALRSLNVIKRSLASTTNPTTSTPSPKEAAAPSAGYSFGNTFLKPTSFFFALQLNTISSFIIHQNFHLTRRKFRNLPGNLLVKMLFQLLLIMTALGNIHGNSSKRLMAWV